MDDGPSLVVDQVASMICEFMNDPDVVASWVSGMNDSDRRKFNESLKEWDKNKAGKEHEKYLIEMNPSWAQDGFKITNFEFEDNEQVTLES